MTQDTGAGSGYGTPPPSSSYGSGSEGSFGTTDGSSAAHTTPITTPASTPGATPDDASTTDVAKDQARQVGSTAKDAGAHVAGTAKDQAMEVAAEAKTQARDLISEGRTQVRDQARQGQERAAGGLSSLSDELRQMADTGQTGMASDLARQAADKAGDLATWLQNREPGDLIAEARNWARRNPGTFLIGAAVAGLAVGRLTRGIVDDKRDTSGNGSANGMTGSAHASGGYDATAHGADTRYRTSSDPGYGTNGLAAVPTPAPTTSATPAYDSTVSGTDYDPAYTGGGGYTATTGDLGTEFGRGQTAPGMGAPGTGAAYDPQYGDPQYSDPQHDDRGYGTGGGTGRTTP